MKFSILYELDKQHEYLGKFYDVENYQELVEIQSKQIEKLQAKLPENKQPIRTHVREG